MKLAMKTARARRVVALLLALPAAAGAHDFWIEPSSFEPFVGETITVRLFVGDGAEIEELGRSSELLLRFEGVQEGTRVPIPGRPRSTPAGRTRFDSPGWAALVYQSRHSYVELPAAEFESYLQDEGLEEISIERERRGEGLAPARESYARSCKSLLRVGAEPTNRRDAEVGLPIELIAEDDPFAWRDGDSLSFRLLFEGRPLFGRLVKLVHLETPELRLAARSDAAGRVRFHPPRGGAWRVVAVHMIRAGPELPGEWESFWASLTFSLAE